MRQIKFRGKRPVSGEWIYGSLSIWTDEAVKYYYIREFEHWGSGYEVAPETVGQFTGLKDRKGSEIYEGDIIQCYTRDPYGNLGRLRKFVVEWRVQRNMVGWNMGAGSIDLREVIGNATDNPELAAGSGR